MKTTAALVTLLLLAHAASAQIASDVNRHQAREHYRRGQELLVAERYEQAAAEFTTATEFDPLLTLAHYGRGQAYMALRRYASAIQAFLGARRAYETIASIRQKNLAQAQRLETDEIMELRDSIRRMSTQVNVNAMTRFRIEQRLEELEAMRRGTRSGDVSVVPAELLLALGSAYYRNGDHGQAEREWRAAVTVNPRLGEAHNNLAAHYLAAGRKPEATAALDAAVRAGYRIHPQLAADIRGMTPPPE